jgi:2-polyprenyl-3-methyl-5-hydroxy-6-metoxy-1,4-benzoquinol methylase
MRQRANDRFAHERVHGKHLLQGDPELIWGWGTPAGRLRAQRRAQLILEGAGAGRGSRILEIGCGTGMFTEMFARSGADITAVDLSPELLEVARGRGLPSSQVRFVEKNFEDSMLDGPFDAVIGSSVLHHLDLDKAWPRIHELLKPGGRLSFAEPNMLNPQVFAERNFRRFFPQVSPDETAFVRTTLRSTLYRIGFVDIAIKPFDWLHPAAPPVLIPLISSLGDMLERVWPLREFAGSLWIRARRAGAG